MNSSEISKKVLENLKLKYDNNTIAICSMCISFHSAVLMQTHAPVSSFDSHFFTLSQLIGIVIDHDPRSAALIEACLNDCQAMVESNMIMCRQDHVEQNSSGDAAKSIVKNLLDGLTRRD